MKFRFCHYCRKYKPDGGFRMRLGRSLVKLTMTAKCPDCQLKRTLSQAERDAIDEPKRLELQALERAFNQQIGRKRAQDRLAKEDLDKGNKPNEYFTD